MQAALPKAPQNSRLKSWLAQINPLLDSQQDCTTLPDVLIRRIDGGNNNALFRIIVGDDDIACKLCVRDERQRARREYHSLRILQAAGLQIAPQPLALIIEPSITVYPAVFYRWATGHSLQTPVSKNQRQAILDSYHALHSLSPGEWAGTELPAAWFHWFDFRQYLGEIQELHALYVPWLESTDLAGTGLGDRLANVLAACRAYLSQISVSAAQADIPVCLVRVDPNLANAVWGVDESLRWVDWEYSGWGDPALDLAELRWHAALKPLGQENLDWLRHSYHPNPQDRTFWERVAAWDHILATRWPYLVLRVLWSKYNGPDRERLSSSPADTRELQERLVELLERSEEFLL